MDSKLEYNCTYKTLTKRSFSGRSPSKKLRIGRCEEARGWGGGGGIPGFPSEQVLVTLDSPWMYLQTDMTENITFPNYECEFGNIYTGLG